MTERNVDILTLALAAVVFLAIAVKLVVPWRRPDRLTVALCGVFLTWGVILTLGLLSVFGWLPPRLPVWERWLVRLALNVFGLGVLWGLIRMDRKKV
jgi:uncharacterized protein YhhL (DUF1145 family)